MVANHEGNWSPLWMTRRGGSSNTRGSNSSSISACPMHRAPLLQKYMIPSYPLVVIKRGLPVVSGLSYCKASENASKFTMGSQCRVGQDRRCYLPSIANDWFTGRSRNSSSAGLNVQSTHVQGV